MADLTSARCLPAYPYVRLTGDECNDLPEETQQELFAWARANGVQVPDGSMLVVCVTVDHAMPGSPHLYVNETSKDGPFVGQVRELPLTEPLPEHLAKMFTGVATSPVEDFLTPR